MSLLAILTKERTFDGLQAACWAAATLNGGMLILGTWEGFQLIGWTTKNAGDPGLGLVMVPPLFLLTMLWTALFGILGGLFFGVACRMKRESGWGPSRTLTKEALGFLLGQIAVIVPLGLYAIWLRVEYSTWHSGGWFADLIFLVPNWTFFGLLGMGLSLAGSLAGAIVIARSARPRVQ